MTVKSEKKNKILIIEDEKAVVFILQRRLEQDGFLVFSAEDGKKGLAMAQKERPDLILLDIIMPNMDGVACLKELRQKSWGKKIPVVILTNLSQEEKKAELLKAGAKGYLIKNDWRMSDISTKVTDWLK